ncbi:TrkH family potassium uptake protein [Sporosarcina sp. CAU 1771]
MQSFNDPKRILSPPLVIAGSYLLLIIVGTILLKSPISTTHSISFTDALFTATSASTVTGLTVFNPGTTLTLFGQIVLLILIQFGGIGLMTFGVMILTLLRRKIGLQNRIYVQESFNLHTIGGMVKLVREIIIFAFAIEAIGIFLLSLYWGPSMGWSNGIFASVFHVISAFNNAGFSTFPDNLIGFADDPIVTFILSSLFIIGGLGFIVVIEVIEKRNFRKWSLHTKIMLLGTLFINSTATLTLFLFEFNNTKTIGDFSLTSKLMASYFQAVSPRTAGFNIISVGDMTDPSLLITMLLMFIGGGSASTASGIKLTTFIVILFATFSYLKRIPEPHFIGKTLKTETMIRAVAITVVSSGIVFFFILLLTFIEKIPLLPMAFEVVSAFGTVGLSMGITGSMSDFGKVLLCIVMFIGRIGPLTLFFLVRSSKEHIHYPYEEIQTG